MTYCSGCGKQLAAENTQCPSCGKLVPGAEAPKTSRAAWLMVGAGCLVVAVIVIGIFAALIIPNLLDAMQKAKTKRTMADMRNLGTAIETYRIDHGGEVPAVGSVDALIGELGDYLGEPTRLDGWERPFLYSCWSRAGEDGCDTYVLASGGRDGSLEHDDLAEYDAAMFDSSDYDQDLVYRDGELLRAPE